jgi:hypothetical protein
MEFKKTAAEMLEYYKTDVFSKMGIEIEGLQNKFPRFVFHSFLL